MKKKRGKKAQFYIIAAIIIVLVVISISSIATYSIVRSQPKSVVELSRTLETESPGIIRYGIRNNQNVTSLMENFTEKDFATYFGLSPDYATTNITFVYGNKTQLAIVRYIKVESQITVGTIKTTTREIQIDKRPLIPTPGKEITIKVDKKDYTFKLEDGQIFYFVLSNENNGEIYIETPSAPSSLDEEEIVSSEEQNNRNK